MISDRRLYLTRDGDVVEEGDERAHTLLVGKGCRIPDRDAIKHGLIDEKALASPPSHKAVLSPAATKAAGHPPKSAK